MLRAFFIPERDYYGEGSRNKNEEFGLCLALNFDLSESLRVVGILNRISATNP
jgi:hypothetical protein